MDLTHDLAALKQTGRAIWQAAEADRLRREASEREKRQAALYIAIKQELGALLQWIDPTSLVLPDPLPSVFDVRIRCPHHADLVARFGWSLNYGGHWARCPIQDYGRHVQGPRPWWLVMSTPARSCTDLGVALALAEISDSSGS